MHTYYPGTSTASDAILSVSALSVGLCPLVDFVVVSFIELLSFRFPCPDSRDACVQQETSRWAQDMCRNAPKVMTTRRQGYSVFCPRPQNMTWGRLHPARNVPQCSVSMSVITWRIFSVSSVLDTCSAHDFEPHGRVHFGVHGQYARSHTSSTWLARRAFMHNNKTTKAHTGTHWTNGLSFKSLTTQNHITAKLAPGTTH